jgi:hypothetical protein
MSTLVAQTISNGTVSTSSANVIQGSAKAWGSYAFVGNGSTPSLNAAFNISSITRNSAGNYTFAFTNALPNANYAATSSCGIFTLTNDSAPTILKAKSTSSFNVVIGYTTGTAITPFDYGIDFVIHD